jgi:hypothetical protein
MMEKFAGSIRSGWRLLVKRGDLVIKVKGYSDKNKVGVVLEDLMINPTGNEFIDVMVDGVKQVVMKVGDLISFKPKTFGDDDWSNPGIVLDSYLSDDRQSGGWLDEIWIVWIDGGRYMVNLRNDDVVYLTSTLQDKG